MDLMKMFLLTINPISEHLTYSKNVKVIFFRFLYARGFNLRKISVSGSPDHPCLTNRGGCSHVCIPLDNNQRKCGCSVGYQLGETETECRQYTSFAVITQLQSARGFDLTHSAEAMVPVSGKGIPRHKTYWNDNLEIAWKNIFTGHNILHLDFLFEDEETTSASRKNNVWIYWVDFEQVNDLKQTLKFIFPRVEFDFDNLFFFRRKVEQTAFTEFVLMEVSFHR